MIDLADGLEKFIANEWKQYAPDLQGDNDTIRLLKDRSNGEARVLQMHSWLRSYQVFQGLTRHQREVVASNVVEFYDLKRRDRLRSNNHIFKEFHHLEEMIRKGADLVTKDGNPRGIESLTSKALWCCYPFDVPILDAFAESSLRVLARFADLSVPFKKNRYEQYVELWFKVYKTVELEVISFSLKSETYPLRVFDRYLWWLGQSSYAGLTES